MGEPSIHMTMALSSPLIPAFQACLFTAAVFWMFDAAIAITPGGETSQTDHIYSPPQTWGINAHRDHVCRSLSRLNDFSNISLGSLLSGTQAPCKFTAVMVDDVVDAKFL